MLTKDQIKEAVENLEVVLQVLCSGREAELAKGDIGWVRIAIRALSGEETSDSAVEQQWCSCGQYLKTTTHVCP